MRACGDLEHGGRGHRQPAVRGVDAARAERQRAAGEAPDAEQPQADDGVADVDGADLVQGAGRQRFRGGRLARAVCLAGRRALGGAGAVDRGLGLAEQAEDARGPGAIGRREAGARDQVEDVAEGARRRVAVSVDGDGGGGEARALRGGGLDAPAGEAQRLERGGEVVGGEVVGGEAGGDDRAEQHVAGDAGDGVGVGGARAGRLRRRC